MKVVVVGGVAGGASAVARLRRLSEDVEITMIEKTGYISYANCGLPYYLGDVITQKEKLTLQTPQGFSKRFNVDVLVNHEVLSIDRENKVIQVKNLLNGETISKEYDKLILSPGAKAIKPNFTDVNDEKVKTLKTVEDTFEIYDYIKNNNVTNAVVIGGGFIGLEVCENFIHRNIDTSLVEMAGQILTNIDYDMIKPVHKYLADKGLKLNLNTAVKDIVNKGKTIDVILSSGDVINTDLVVLAIGVAPNNTLAKDCGLKLNDKGAIIVDDTMKTSDNDIYAVGDAVEIRHRILNKKMLISLAGPANKQGRLVAGSILGKNNEYKGAIGTSIIKLFDMAVGSTGINETVAKNNDIDYEKIVIYSMSHASYYPNAKDLCLKLLYDKNTHLILGGQVIGYDGVDKRLDVLATAINSKMKVYDLIDIDLSYAPPFGLAKDPINMLGYIADNIINGVVKQFHWHDIENLVNDDNNIMLDVRTSEEYSLGHIKNSVNIPLDELRENISTLDKTKKIYVNCHSGLRSYLACRILSNLGYDCYNLSGGFRFMSSVINEDDTIIDLYPCGVKK